MSDAARPRASAPSPASPAPGAGLRALVVDDEAGVRDLLRRWLEALGFDVVAACSAEDALQALDASGVALALCDIRMPGRDGLWLADRIRQRSPDTAIVMASGLQDVGSAVTSLHHGVIDYLMKPFGRDRLREAVERAVVWHEAAVSARRSAEARAAEADQRLQRLARAVRTLGVDSLDGLFAVLTLMDLRDPSETGDASQLVDHAADTARRLALRPEAIDQLVRAAVLHRALKLALVPAVSRPEGPWSPADADLLRRAPIAAPALFRTVPFLAHAARLLACRHEHFDGTGVPGGLNGEAIPVECRLLAVVETYDDLARGPGHPIGVGSVEALAEIERASGTRFDPAVVAAFAQALSAAAP